MGEAKFGKPGWWSRVVEELERLRVIVRHCGGNNEVVVNRCGTGLDVERTAVARTSLYLYQSDSKRGFKEAFPIRQRQWKFDALIQTEE